MSTIVYCDHCDKVIAPPDACYVLAVKSPQRIDIGEPIIHWHLHYGCIRPFVMGLYADPEDDTQGDAGVRSDSDA